VSIQRTERNAELLQSSFVHPNSPLSVCNGFVDSIRRAYSKPLSGMFFFILPFREYASIVIIVNIPRLDDVRDRHPGGPVQFLVSRHLTKVPSSTTVDLRCHLALTPTLRNCGETRRKERNSYKCGWKLGTRYTVDLGDIARQMTDSPVYDNVTNLIYIEKTPFDVELESDMRSVTGRWYR